MIIVYDIMLKVRRWNMPNYKEDIQYMNIIRHIINNEDFMVLKDVKHHNITRLDHSLKVSYYSYKISKLLHLGYEETARAGLLHDFYLEQIDEQEKIKDKILLFSTEHPKTAVNNSLKYFDLSDKEVDIIKTHMFPTSFAIPKYMESWIVSIVDKFVSTKEFGYKFHQRLLLAKTYLYVLVVVSFFK